MFRPLTESETELRVQQCTQNGCSLLLYKNSRTDMNLLDECVGADNWQSDYKECKGTLFCGIGIRIANEWVWKWNAGAPSTMDAAKGEASDALKRAGFCWGLGRELYTAPRIWIKKGDCNLTSRNGKWQCYDRFEVEKMRINDGRITGLAIRNATLDRRVFVWYEDE